ncbi:MAG TPA: non-homologous end-joining DNA ligase [Methanothrix sp.]|nr:non-homologous end-joining DNA ligase [Methanothrix sp.]HPT18879.1 non-homologous end-joining DNA ligase [Methanothrix sp.]
MSEERVLPMLAVSGRPFGAVGWIFEPKIDGTRCLAWAGGGGGRESVLLYNRRQIDITHRYPEIAADLDAGGPRCLLDGEIAVFSEGRPSFASLARRDHQSEALKIEYLSKNLPASFVVFDILSLRGESLMGLPLSARKEILREVVSSGEQVVLVDSFPEKGTAYFQAALKMGIEGVMAKRLESTYQPGSRSRDWVKIKKSLKLDLVVGGYIPGTGKRSPFFGGLLLGAYREGHLQYIGRVGSGFSDEELSEISGSFSPRETSPFAFDTGLPRATWVEPQIVVQVTALEVTADGHLRAPVFLRSRDDKDPLECTVDQLL